MCSKTCATTIQRKWFIQNIGKLRPLIEISQRWLRELKGSDCSLLIETNLIIINSNIHSPLSSSDHDDGGFHFSWTVAKRNESRRKSGEFVSPCFPSFLQVQCFAQIYVRTTNGEPYCDDFFAQFFGCVTSSPAREPLNLKLLFRLHNKTMRDFCLRRDFLLFTRSYQLRPLCRHAQKILLERLRKGCLRICVATATHKFIKRSFIKVFWVQSLCDPTPTSSSL